MLRAAASPPGFPTLVCLTGLTVLSLNMFLPALPALARDLEADYALAALSVAGYLAVTAVLQLALGPLSDRFGRRPVLLSATLIFSAASLGCALAQDIGTFLAFRMAQGVVIAGATVTLAVIRDTSEPRAAARLMGYVNSAMALAPMLGPMVGGALAEALGWRAIFFGLSGLGGLAALLVWADLGETRRSRAGGLAAQLRAYPELLRSRRFWGCALCMAFSTSAFYVFLSGAPLVADARFGLTPGVLGACMGLTTGGYMLGNLAAARAAEDRPLTDMMLLGRLVACGGLAAGLAALPLGLAGALPFFAAAVAAGGRQRADHAERERRGAVGGAASGGQRGGAVGSDDRGVRGGVVLPDRRRDDARERLRRRARPDAALRGAGASGGARRATAGLTARRSPCG